MTRHYIIPIFVPHFGCPHDCVFCNQRKITGLTTNVTNAEVKKIIDEHLATFKTDSLIEVAFYGGSFTAIEKELQEELLKVPFEYKLNRLIHNIRLSTRPDAIDEEILELLEKYSVDTIELGVQSLEEDVLELSERGHSAEDVYRATKLIKEWGFKLGHQIMLGLPGDNKGKSFTTARKILELQPDMIRIYPTLVIRNTELENMMIKNLYVPLDLDEAIRISSRILMAFTLADIPVIRVGLQPTDNIQLGKDVVAGPFHPAFRQLVEEYNLRLLLKQYKINNLLDTENKDIIIKCSNTMTSVVAGQQGKNRDVLKEEFRPNKLRIQPQNMDHNKIIFSIDGKDTIIDLKDEMKSYIKNNPL